MAYTTSKSTSYGQRLIGSLKSIGFGVILLIAASILLFYNEGRYVKQGKAINETQSVTVHVDDMSTVDLSLNGKVIHAGAFANTEEMLADPQFGVSTVAIELRREVEYYQYQENVSTRTRDKVGGGREEVKTYTYEKKWTLQPVNSEKFTDPAYQQSNFVLANLEANTQIAQHVTFGAYTLPPSMVRSIGGSVGLDFALSDEQRQYWEEAIAKNQNATGGATMVHQHGNVAYFGKSETNPEIGDVRITFTKVEPKDISIIAQVNGNTFEPYIAKNGRDFSRVAAGNVSAAAMFADAHSSNSTLTWVLRIIGIILVMVGLGMMFSILPTLFKVIPFLGSIVGAGVGLVCIVGGLAWSMLMISFSWLFYRPLIGIPLLAVTVAGIWYLRKKGEGKR